MEARSLFTGLALLVFVTEAAAVAGLTFGVSISRALSGLWCRKSRAPDSETKRGGAPGELSPPAAAANGAAAVDDHAAGCATHQPEISSSPPTSETSLPAPDAETSLPPAPTTEPSPQPSLSAEPSPLPTSSASAPPLVAQQSSLLPHEIS